MDFSVLFTTISWVILKDVILFIKTKNKKEVFASLLFLSFYTFLLVIGSTKIFEAIFLAFAQIGKDLHFYISPTVISLLLIGVDIFAGFYKGKVISAKDIQNLHLVNYLNHTIVFGAFSLALLAVLCILYTTIAIVLNQP